MHKISWVKLIKYFTFYFQLYFSLFSQEKWINICYICECNDKTQDYTYWFKIFM